MSVLLRLSGALSLRRGMPMNVGYEPSGCGEGLLSESRGRPLCRDYFSPDSLLESDGGG